MITLPQITTLVALLLASTSLAEPAEKPPQDNAANAGQVTLKFQAYDGDPAKPDTMTFQINALGLRQPTEFLSIGQTIANTSYKLTGFAFKVFVDAQTGRKDDVSELTLTHTGTKQALNITLNRAVPIDMKAEVRLPKK